MHEAQAAGSHGGGPEAGHGGAHEGSHVGEYVKTGVSLAVLTVVEFGLAYLIQHGTIGMMTGIVLLVGLAFVKAYLVGRFFMHLKYDPRILAFLAVIPVILATPLILIAGFDFCRGPAY